jgi:hypothetical protein
MKSIPPENKILYDAVLIKKGGLYRPISITEDGCGIIWIFVLNIITNLQIRKVMLRLFKN